MVIWLIANWFNRWLRIIIIFIGFIFRMILISWIKVYMSY